MAKVKVDLRAARKKIQRYQRVASRALERPLKREIVQSINKGISPVKGGGRFSRYSDSYRESITDGRFSRFSKTRSPVNLRLSGRLLNSIFSSSGRGTITIGFDNELADIHTNKGAGKSRTIRKMLPQNNESFTRSITLRLGEVLRRVARQIFR